MDHQGSSGMAAFQAGSQNEPFFELLHSTTAPSTANSSGNTSYSGVHSKRENSLPEFDFGNDDVLPSFDFQPITSTAGSGNKFNAASPGMRGEENFDFQPIASTAVTGNKLSASSSGLRGEESRGRQSSSTPAYATSQIPATLRTMQPPSTYEKDTVEAATVAAVEGTMKKYADNLLRVLEGMSGRLTQLESTTQRLEHLVSELKGEAANNSGSTDGKLRSLENMIREVQRGVQVLRDRQEISEAHSQLAKLQLSKTEMPPTAPAPVQAALEAPPSPPSPPKQVDAPPQQQLAPPYLHHQQQLPSPPAPPPLQPPPSPPASQQLPPQQHQQLQLQAPSATQAEPHYQQPSLPPGPPPHQLQPQNSMAMQSFYAQQQPPQLQQQQQLGPHTQLPQQYSHQAEAPPYGPHPQVPHQGPQQANYVQELAPPPPPYLPQGYGSRPLPPPQMQQSQPPSQQQLGPSGPQVYELPVGRNNSGQLALPPPYHSQGQVGPSMYDSQMMGQPGYTSSVYRVAQPVLPSAPSSGSGGYPRLPTAQPVQQSLPPAGANGAGPSGGAPLSTNRVPIDEVIEKVAVMGFSKDQVRAVVRRLTENGQSVDLNIVLDKLMNGGGEVQPQKGWFGR